MNSLKNESNSADVINTLNAWPVVFIVGMGVFAILLMQSLWDTMSGLFFQNAYEAIVIPYTIYIVLSIYWWGNGEVVNKTKLFCMSVSFLLLFLPCLYLVISGQLDAHSVIFSEYDSSLSHIASNGEAIMARFVIGVWRHDNRLDFNFIDAAKSLNGQQMKIITDWLSNPFWP